MPKNNNKTIIKLVSDVTYSNCLNSPCVYFIFKLILHDDRHRITKFNHNKISKNMVCYSRLLANETRVQRICIFSHLFSHLLRFPHTNNIIIYHYYDGIYVHSLTTLLGTWYSPVIVQTWPKFYCTEHRCLSLLRMANIIRVDALKFPHCIVCALSPLCFLLSLYFLTPLFMRTSVCHPSKFSI